MYSNIDTLKNTSFVFVCENYKKNVHWQILILITNYELTNLWRILPSLKIIMYVYPMLTSTCITLNWLNLLTKVAHGIYEIATFKPPCIAYRLGFMQSN